MSFRVCDFLKRNYVPILWLIILLIVVPVLSADRTIGGLIGSLIIVILTFEFNFFMRYASFSTFTIATFISIFIGYFMALSTMVLLPLDVSLSIVDRSKKAANDSADHEDQVLICWNLLYWGMFVLNTIVFKLQLIYNQAGHLKIMKKISWTLKTFLKQIVILLIVFAILCICVSSIFKINGLETVKSALLILINVYGLLILTFLLGFGLVQLPWFIWTRSYPDHLLRLELSKSDEFFSKYRESQVELNEAAKSYQELIEKIPPGHEFYGYVEFMKKEIPIMEEISGSFSRTVGKEIKDKELKEKKIDMKALTKLNEDAIASSKTNLILKIYNLQKWESKWRKHCDFIFQIADMGNIYGDHDSKKDNKQNLLNQNITAQTLSLGWIIFYRSVSLLLFSFSLLIMFCEATLVAGQHDSVLVFSKLVKSIGDEALFILLVLIILLLLSYLVFTSYFALFRLEKGLVFELSPGHTHAMTMMRSVTLCLNLATPLCYNLMMLMNEISPPTIENHLYSSAFSQFFVPMKKVPFFGDYYNTIVPLFIAIIGLITAFKFFGKLLARVTKGLISFEVSEVNQEKIGKGEKVIIREWERRNKKIKAEELAKSKASAQSKASMDKSFDQTKKASAQSKASMDKSLGQTKFEPKQEKTNNSLKQDSIEEQSFDSNLNLAANIVNNSSGTESMEELRGYLSKRKSKMTAWKKRFFCVINNNTLCYYTDDKLNKKKGEIPFSTIKNIEIEKNKKEDSKINIITDKRTFFLKAETGEEARKWVIYLNYMLNLFQINNL